MAMTKRRRKKSSRKGTRRRSFPGGSATLYHLGSGIPSESTVRREMNNGAWSRRSPEGWVVGIMETSRAGRYGYTIRDPRGVEVDGGTASFKTIVRRVAEEKAAGGTIV